ncbi:inositol polyphosphate multikinase-like isoform X3 [Phlebotomus papatasi]|uniref:inositol polyphosphate multikinase-like isoform X3 n=1 Tax=Phlebotomus papatasi TaxID=29031 RepID=UPI0024842D40|nr:inositol polyphosphate multikinase-like isoform X3 [Phlebotomus papatasi]
MTPRVDLYERSLYRKSCPPLCSLPFSEMTSVPSNNIPNLPVGFMPLENQVAGHTFQAGEIGILRENDGTILKPAAKPLCGAREIKFYETLADATDPSLITLRDLVPEYRGTQKIFVGDRYVDFMKLVDATDGMLEPCIMDVKIGARTWDPLATEEKRAAEEQKYLSCKKALGLCIPGFQVYHLATGRVKRYSKDYGKKLNEKSVKDALRIFLNADSGLSRALLVQLLSGLWAIQKWARTQKTLRLYSSSVLLIYDARRLRSNLESKRRISAPNGNSTTPPTAECNGSPTPFNWNVTPAPDPIQSYQKIQRSHSAQNNYDEDLKEIRDKYNFMLHRMCSVEKKEWAIVKMIDFAHAFPAEQDSLDTNYLFGIENLVKMFEEFLKECE